MKMEGISIIHNGDGLPTIYLNFMKATFLILPDTSRLSFCINYLVTGRIDRNAYSYSKGKQCLTLTVANKGLFENSECHGIERKGEGKDFPLD